MYHRVESDHAAAFARQLDYIEKIGSFISLGDAMDRLQGGDDIGGRYFCLTFDDGYKSAFTNAYSELAERGIPATFFVVPNFVGSGPDYVTWDECRSMSAGGMTLGSHSLNHRNLAGLSETESRQELSLSKEVISEQVGVECNQFACPWGQPIKDFVPERDPDLAQQIGYRSFMSTVRGSVTKGHRSIVLPRDQIEPH